MELTKYNAAKQALAECRSVDEVKDIRDRAMAWRLYAKQAKDRTLEEDAIEIRMRAERMLGEMMKEQPKHEGGRPITGVSNTPVNSPMTLAEAGIDKNLAKRARSLANLEEDDFEALVKETRSTLRTHNPKPIIEPENDDASILINYLTAHNFKLGNLRQSQLRSLERSLRALLDKVVTCLRESQQPKHSSSQHGRTDKEEKELAPSQEYPHIIEFPPTKRILRM